MLLVSIVGDDKRANTGDHVDRHCHELSFPRLEAELFDDRWCEESECVEWDGLGTDHDACKPQLSVQKDVSEDWPAEAVAVVDDLAVLGAGVFRKSSSDDGLLAFVQERAGLG